MAPRGQRAVGMRQWRRRVVGGVGGLGARLESRLVFTLGHPCWEHWPPDHVPRAAENGTYLRTRVVPPNGE